MKNLKEFKALIERYRSITIEEVEEAWGESTKNVSSDFIAFDTANSITGYGSLTKCSLCSVIYAICPDCVYGHITNNNDVPCTYHITYDAIKLSKSPTELLQAFRNRADYMENLLTNYKEIN